MRTKKYLATVATLSRVALSIGAIVFSPTVVGHGFGQRYDLPVPLWLWVIGAGLTIVASFVIVGVVSQDRRGTTAYPRVNLLRVEFMRSLAHWLSLGL